MSTSLIVVIGIIGLIIFSGVKVLYEYERGVVFRLGRLSGTKGPGFKWIIPGIDKLMKISLRVITMKVGCV